MNYWQNAATLKESAALLTKNNEKKYVKEIRNSFTKSKIYSINCQRPDNDKASSEIIFLKSTSVEAAFQTYQSNKKMCILNFASYEIPGGKFMEGSSAQEESLCHSSFLYNVLRQGKQFYAWNKVNRNHGLYLNRAVYSPEITFWHNSEIRQFDILSCAAPNRRWVERDNAINEQNNDEALKSRILFIRNILEQNNVDIAVLGAFGCGVFRQNPEKVAQYFKEAIIYTSIDTIVFAVPDKKNYEIFKQILEK